jgi:hypothetical protein
MDRVEMRKPKRVSAKSKGLLDVDGKRAYAIMKCIHGCSDEIEVLRDTFTKHKVQAIEDHLSTCKTCPPEERTPRKNRGVHTAKSLLDSSAGSIVERLHEPCRAKIEACEARITTLNADMEEHGSRLKSLEADRDALKGILAAEHRVLRGQFLAIELPLTDKTGAVGLKRAMLEFGGAESAKQARRDEEGRRAHDVEMQQQLEAKCIENQELRDRLRQYNETFGPLPTAAPVAAPAAPPLDHAVAFAQLDDAQRQRERPDPDDFLSLSSDATQAFRNQARRSGRAEAGDLATIDD